MKNNIFRIVSCIVLISVLSVYLFGCKSKKDDTATEPNVLNYEELSQENGTAVVKYTAKDGDGNDKDFEDTIDMEDVDKVVTSLNNSVITSSSFTSKLYKDYEMSEETAKQIAQEPNLYREFHVTEYIQNNSDKIMAYSKAKITDNGKNGVWVSTKFSGDLVTVPPGGIEPVYITGIAKADKNNSEQIQSTFDNISVEIIYTYVESAQDDEIDWDNVETYTLKIH